MKSNDSPRRIGSYQIERRIPKVVGSNVQTYVARLGLWRPRAERFTLTTIEPRRATDAAFVDQFLAAAGIALRLRHPNIIAATTLGHDAAHGWFLAMEAVSSTLQQILDKGPLPVSTAIYVASEMLRGLAFSHRLTIPGQDSPGLMHAALSPDNVFLTRNGAVKVSNTGLQRVTWNRDAVMMVDTISRYMSPEQVRGTQLDGRSDMFSVGALLWEMLTGRPLFGGATVEAVLTAIDHGPIVSPRELRPELPADVCQVVMRLLARDPSERSGDACKALSATAGGGRRPTLWH
jgi:eukaryotic-like serine/threonine-protein kinase